MLNLKNKNVFITGAASGMGRACAVKFAENGANVALADIAEDNLEKVKQELLQKYQTKVKKYILDVSNENMVNDIILKA